MSRETIQSYDDVATLLARQGVFDANYIKPGDEGQRAAYTRFDITERKENIELIKAVHAAGWSVGSLAINEEGDRGYISSEIDEAVLTLLKPYSQTLPQIKNDGYVNLPENAVKDMVPRNRVLSRWKGVPAANGVAVADLAMQEFIGLPIAEQSMVGTVPHFIIGSVLAGGAYVWEQRRSRQRLVRDTTSKYAVLKDEIQRTGTPLSNELIYLEDRSADNLNAGLKLVPGLPEDTSVYEHNRALNRCNVYQTVTEILIKAGTNAPVVWRDRLKYPALSATESADQMRITRGVLRQEEDISTFTGIENPRVKEIKDEYHEAAVALVGRMTVLAEVYEGVLYDNRSKALEDLILGLTQADPLDFGKDFGSEIEKIYKKLFSGLLEVSADDKNAIGFCTEVISDFQAVTGRIKHFTHVQMAEDYLTGKYPQLFAIKK